MGICFAKEGEDANVAGGERGFSSQRKMETDSALALLYGWRKQTSQLELSVSCQNLVDSELLVKSDSMAVLYLLGSSGEWEEIGRTEVVLNSQSPTFVTPIRFLYKFEENQRLMFRIYDLDDKSHLYEGQDTRDIDLNSVSVLGESEIQVPEILTKGPHRTHTWSLKPGHDSAKASNLGTITVRTDEISYGHHLVTLQLRGSQLVKRDIFSASDPFVRISRRNMDGDDASWTPIFKTEVVVNNNTPTWDPVKVRLEQLCAGDKDRPILFEVFDFDLNGKHQGLGCVEASFNELQASMGGEGWDLQMPVRKSKPDGPKKIMGKFFVDSISLTLRPTFLDFIFGGCQLSFMVAIDFTASNGDPHTPGTLHYFDPDGEPNAYQKAIRAVGDILQFYDHDKKFPLWGFGAQFGNGPVSHAFPLNGNPEQPQVDRIEGIAQHYEKAIHEWSLAGPTFFKPVLDAAQQFASEYVSQERQKYFVLLILTDGNVTDLDDTVDAIVASSELPLTVNILGIGDGPFNKLEILDNRKAELEDVEGRKPVRDNVNFIPMKDSTAEEVAQKMLADLPGQLLEFMAIKGFTPNKRNELLSLTQVDTEIRAHHESLI